MAVDTRQVQGMTRLRLVAICAGVALIAALAWSQYWVVTGRVGTVVQGRLYRSAGLPPERLLDLARQHNITTVIDFRKAAEGTRAEHATLEQAGIRYVPIPSEQVPSPDAVARFLQVMDDRTPGSVLIHCTHGVGRTGVFTAIYRMEYQGWSRTRAVTEAMVYAGFGSFGPWNEKTVFLFRYTPRSSPRPR